MARINTTSSELLVDSAGQPQWRADQPDTTKQPRSRPEITGAEKHHLLVVSEFFDPCMTELELPPQRAGIVDDAIFRDCEFDLEPMSRTLIMLSPRPRNYLGTSDLAQAADVEATGAGNQLEVHLSGIEFAPAPAPGWGGWLSGLFGSAWSCWQREREVSRSIEALSSLDDRSLRDIGIHHRLQISGFVRTGRRDT